MPHCFKALSSILVPGVMYIPLGMGLSVNVLYADPSRWRLLPALSFFMISACSSLAKWPCICGFSTCSL